MTGPEMAALVAGVGILMMTFGVFQIASAALLDSRLRVFVRRRGVVVQPTSVRRARKESKVALVETINKKLRQANYGKKLQHTLIQAGVEMQAARFLTIQVIAAAGAFLVVWSFADTVPGIARMMLIVGVIGMLARFYALKKIADIEV